jgi:mono/diheme cytochrome c family protein
MIRHCIIDRLVNRLLTALSGPATVQTLVVYNYRRGTMAHGLRFVISTLVIAAAVSSGCRSTERARQTVEEERRLARIERGRYLVEGLLDCFTCHSEVDWTVSDVPVKPGRKGCGAVFPGEILPFPIVAPNISPDPETGAGKWSNEQFARAIRNGVGHDGRVLFPIMPYTGYRALSDGDLAAVIAYVRSVPPVRNAIARIELPPPVTANLKAPPPVSSQPEPNLSAPVRRGAYLVTIGGCADCHTPPGKDMQPRADLAFAGGFVLKGPWGQAAAANITPDPSGISYYDEALFLQAMRTGHVKARKLNQIMRWSSYRNLTDEDLKAMFAHLRTLKPVAHRVDNTEPPTLCKTCGFPHGLGAMNR